MIFELTIEIPPVAKGRPRVSPASYTFIAGKRIKTASAHSYTPTATRSYEDRFGWALRQAGVRPVAGPLGLVVVFHTRARADIDNLLKACMDAANGIAYLDDAQVRNVAMSIEDDTPPRTDLLMYRLAVPDTN